MFSLAGSRKGAIANTTAEMVESNEGPILICFFCKRDDPNYSKPEYLFPTLVYQIASCYAVCKASPVSFLWNLDANVTTPASTRSGRSFISETCCLRYHTLSTPTPSPLALRTNAVLLTTRGSWRNGFFAAFWTKSSSRADQRQRLVLSSETATTQFCIPTGKPTRARKSTLHIKEAKALLRIIRRI